MDNPVEKITFGKGITSIGQFTFSNRNGIYYANKNFLKEVFIPTNVTNIGSGAFMSATSDVIIRTERTKEDFLTNVTVNSTWYGQAQVISSDGLLIY